VRATWRVLNFDETVPMRLRLVLESDNPRTFALVEQAARTWGVELEREPDDDDEKTTPLQGEPML
jgi:hypothetical protein